MLRTYNTLIIACNMCGQPREAMAVYRRMLDEGYSPNATTYNALISAYGKAGQLDKVAHLYILGLRVWIMYKGKIYSETIGQYVSFALCRSI